MSARRRTKKFNRGKWAVERERSRIGEPVPFAGVEDAVPIGCAISSVIGKLGLEKEAWLTGLQEKWAGLVGRAVAEHSRPGSMEGKTLVVFVDSSVWLNELSRFWRPKILSNVQAEFGARNVTAVRFVMDPAGPHG